MLRRNFIQTGTTAAAGLLAASEGIQTKTASANSRPNILWISCEDMSPRLGCYGDRTVPTPNIDSLANEGVLYTHAFATSGVCAPNRHAIITGMYPTSTYGFQMRNHARTSAIDEIKDAETREFAKNRPLYEAVPPPEVKCFPEYLRLTGYYCSNNVKEDYQFHSPVTVWDDSSRQAHWRNRNGNQPFFSVFNFTVTHESGIFGDGRSAKVVDPDDVPVPPYYPDTAIVRQDIAKHYDNIAALDKQVGDLISQLQEDGLMDNTIIFFFGDHGDGLPRGKRWVYDSGTRVPLIVRHPNKANANTKTDRLVSFVDFGPTVLSLAGVEVPNHVHGIPFLGGQEGQPREYVYLHRDRNGENRETIRALRDQRYRYIRNFRPDEPYIKPLAYRDRQAIMQEINRHIEQGKLGADQWQFSAQAKPVEEFYDTENDPFEINNLASVPKYFEKMAEMRSELNEWIERCVDPLDMPEGELVRTRVYPPNGDQYATAQPDIQIKPLQGNTVQISITCPTNGATIGYRIQEKNNQEKNDQAWLIYDGPVEVKASATIEATAHRIGFKPSEKVELVLTK